MSKASAWSRYSTACQAAVDLTERYRNASRAMAALHSIAPASLGLDGEPVGDPIAEVQRWCATLQTVDAALVPDWENGA